jgi:eukaryotic-like serine/threonine-protein kinase
MGEVYKARDSRLDRVVALKVISPLLAASPELRQRFEREARTISQLAHPNICALYDVGEARAEPAPATSELVRYLVLEYCEGQTLADKLRKGPLPVEQAVRIAIDICSALQRAHSAGIIHRDLKPANVMLTGTGAKLLDFGLARPTASLAPNPAASTIQSPLTDRGTILGTYQYMSPEQVEGEEADARSDIWSLGCVIYEMISGHRAFSGKSQSSVIAAILEREPQPLMGSHPEVSAILDALVRACLAKTPADRIQSAHDVGLQLRWISGDSASSQARVAEAPRRRRAWIVPAVAIGVALALAVPAIKYFTTPTPPPPRAVVLSITGPEGQVFSPVDSFALSHDGTALAFTTTGENGQRSLWLRRFDSSSSLRIESVHNPLLPFWSPDGGSIGVFTGEGVQIVNLAAGTARPLVAASPSVGAWSIDGLIVYQVLASGLHVVGADGSGARQLTKLDPAAGEDSHAAPVFIPGTNYLLFTVHKRQGKGRMGSEIRFVSLTTGDVGSVNLSGRVVGFDDGLLMYATPDGTLRAQPWNTQTMAATGPDRPVRQPDQSAPVSDVRFAVSPAHVLAFRGGTHWNRQQLTWFDKTGAKSGTLGEINSYSNPAMSPDGRRVAVGIRSAKSEARDVWVFDVARNTPTRLTHDDADDFAPVWSPDGTRVAFSSDRLGVRNIYATPASGLGPDELLLKSDAAKSVESWSADGRYVLFSSNHNIDALVLPERTVTPVLRGPSSESNAALSPDGTLLAYMSDENGTLEVFIRSFPEISRKWQISKAGGAEPHWRKDSRELYYLAQDELIAVSMTKGPKGLEPQEPRRLFRQRLGPYVRNRYVAAPDGQRFLLNVPATDRTVEPITVILNWQQLPQ